MGMGIHDAADDDHHHHQFLEDWRDLTTQWSRCVVITHAQCGPTWFLSFDNAIVLQLILVG